MSGQMIKLHVRLSLLCRGMEVLFHSRTCSAWSQIQLGDECCQLLLTIQAFEFEIESTWFVRKSFHNKLTWLAGTQVNSA